MAEKQKKTDEEPAHKVGPVIQQTAETAKLASTDATAASRGVAGTDVVDEQQTAPYAEFGGLSQALGQMGQMRQAAGQRREEARKEWERRLGEQSNARLALANVMRPEDTSSEQRKLRNLALGQAVGEFFGALFGGIRGLGGSSGRGYAPKMPGLYRNTLERIDRLKDYDIHANQKFQGLLGSMLERDAADRATVAREGYRETTEDERRLFAAQDYAEREEQRAGNRRDMYERQAVGRKDTNEQQAKFRSGIQQERHEQRIMEQMHAAALKNGAAGMSDEVKYTKMLLLPQTRTSRTNGGKFPTTTVQDRTSYSKQEDAAAEVLAKQVAPIRSRYGLSDAQVRGLQHAILANPQLGVTWEHIDDALARGMTAGQILESLE